MLLVSVLIIVCSTITVSADNEMPGNSFTHWSVPSGTKSVYMRDMFVPTVKINAMSLGLSEGFESISDITVDSNGNLWILSVESRIVVCDKNYNFLKEVNIVADGEEIFFDNAKGIYVDKNNNLYICDTDNERLLICTNDGVVKKTVMCPESQLIPSDFVFMPTRVLTDSKGYLYVISEGCYYGALLFSPNNDFCGFYGADTVENSILSSIENIWNMITENDVKRSKKIKKLPYQYVDMDIDSQDFITTCTGKKSGDQIGQIRRLNTGGVNVLYKENFNGERQASSDVNFGETGNLKRNHKDLIQNFVGVQIDENGIIYALDETFGYIYVYDSECNLLTVFGGGFRNGEIKGQFATATAIDVFDEKIYVADSQNNSVTVFEYTDYGKLVVSARNLTIKAEYTKAEPLWNMVLKLDSNSQLALSGIAKAAYFSGDYERAMSYAKRAYDSATYNAATKMQFKNVLSDNFVWIILGIILIILVIALLISLARKKNIKLKIGRDVKIMLFGVIHPFDNFREMKEKKLSSWKLSTIALLIYYISSFIYKTKSNFRFTDFDPQKYTSIYQLLQTVGFMLVLAIANWGISTLMQGKGKFKDVLAVISYATIPMSCCNIIRAILSNTIISSGSTVFATINTISLILAGIIITIGLMIIHEFTFPQLILSLIVTVLFMILAIFVIFMVAMLLSQCWQFIVAVLLEVINR